MDGRSRGVSRVLVRVLFLNLAVAAAKLILGYATGTVSVISDGYHSLTDSTSNVMGLIGLRIAGKPPDANHPYGHQKAEYLWAVVEGALIVVAALLIFRAAYFGFVEPKPLNANVEGLSFNAAAAVLNGIWATVLMRHGRRLRSPALTADGQHLYTDVLSSAGVLAGLILARLTGWAFLDPLLAALVGITILWSGWTLVRGQADAPGAGKDQIAVDRDLAGIRLLQPREAPQGGRLAAAAGAEQGQQAAFGDLERKVGHGGARDPAIGLAEACDADQRPSARAISSGRCGCRRFR